MKKIKWLAAMLTIFALPALAADPGFNIEALCKKNNTDKTAVRNCIDEEKSVKEEVLEMAIPDAAFKKCMDAARKDPEQANYYSFKTCVEEASQ